VLQHLQLYHKTYTTMKTKILTSIAIMAMLMAGALLSGFNFPQDKWVVPEEYKNMENEYAGEDEDGIGPRRRYQSQGIGNSAARPYFGRSTIANRWRALL